MIVVHFLFSFHINVRFVDQNQPYELYAMVDHFGTLTGGHYTATIKPEGEESWYEFNDSTVTKVRKIILQLWMFLTLTINTSSCCSTVRA